jgi:hypothetical protein
MIIKRKKDEDKIRSCVAFCYKKGSRVDLEQIRSGNRIRSFLAYWSRKVNGFIDWSALGLHFDRRRDSLQFDLIICIANVRTVSKTPGNPFYLIGSGFRKPVHDTNVRSGRFVWGVRENAMGQNRWDDGVSVKMWCICTGYYNLNKKSSFESYFLNALKPVRLKSNCHIFLPCAARLKQHHGTLDVPYWWLFK